MLMFMTFVCAGDQQPASRRRSRFKSSQPIPAPSIDILTRSYSYVYAEGDAISIGIAEWFAANFIYALPVLLHVRSQSTHDIWAQPNIHKHFCEYIIGA